MLNQDYREMLSLLLENDVKFLIVGAYAMAAHGFPRATGDMDIFVQPDPDNAKKIYDVLAKFDTPLKDIKKDDFEKKGTVLQIGVAPRRIDILNCIDGVTFDEAYEDRITVELEGLKIPVISKQKLIQNKRATGRERDKLDADGLSKT